MPVKKGNVPWNKGKTGCYSDETLNKMSLSSRTRKPMSEETKRKIGIGALGRIPWHKGRNDLSRYPGKTPRDRYLRLFYGITEDEYDGMLKDQNGTCKNCKQLETSTNRGTIRRLAVDHNHVTGKVRGLLCARCNLILGKANDSVALLQGLIEYLKEDGTYLP